MGNITLFSALSCQTRIDIIKLLMQEEKHISAIARELHISVPVISRHIQLLEQAGLVSKKVIGNVHLISVNKHVLSRLMDVFIDVVSIEIEKDDSLYEALNQLPFIKVVKQGTDRYISSVDGEEGYYLYEVDGKHPDVSVNNFKPSHDVTVFLSRLVAIHQKKIQIRIKDKKKK
jgi:DNA-binding transcriptional ArsR family regulator